MADHSPDPMRVAIATMSCVVGAIMIILVVLLVRTVLTTTIPFDNDEANHAIDGWEVYRAIAESSPSALVQAVRNQSFYPPVGSLFIAAAYALAGPSIAASRMPSVVSFACVLVGLAYLVMRIAGKQERSCARKGDRWLSVAGAAFAIALAISSRVFVRNSVPCMAEMCGAMLGLLLILVADRADGLPDRRCRWLGIIAASLVAITIFLTKYSFGLFFFAGLTAAILSTNWPRRPNRRAWVEASATVALGAIGIAAWALVTHRQTMAMFFTDHPSYAPLWSERHLLFYPRLWLNGYSANAFVGLAAILLAIIGAVSYWRRLPVRVAFWSIFAGFVVLVISTTDEPRHVLVVIPAIWVLAGLGLASALRWLHRFSRGRFMAIGLLVLLVSMVFGGELGFIKVLPKDLAAEFEGLPVYATMQDYALGQVDLGQPILIVGTISDQNGLLAMRWRAAVLAHESLWNLDIDYFPFDECEHSLMRTHRKPQIATVDRSFPRDSLSAVLGRDYYRYIIAIDCPGDRWVMPDDVQEVLGRQQSAHRDFDGWSVAVYKLQRES